MQFSPLLTSEETQGVVDAFLVFLSNRYHVNTTLFTHQASTGYNPFEGIFALAEATSTFSTYPDFNLSSHHNAISRDRPNA